MSQSWRNSATSPARRNSLQKEATVPCSDTQDNASHRSDFTVLISVSPDKKIKEIKFDDVFNEIKYKTNLRKGPGFDLISGIIVKQLPAIAIKKLVFLYNAVIKLQYVPLQWKKAEIIVIA
ncbi:unnamed protein product [Bemisia tabaci]|uniref:Uncharacterized protein n=1 Tax=Bemisia tabaci TaxID=7038 RepID=A0A9P0ABY0_BEMTA|nr:unnamed protein product [Bemisia tabaci]